MGFLENFNYYWVEKADKRVLRMPIIGHSYYTLLIIFAYLYFVLSLGPRFMKNREPYSLKKFIRIYNLVQIVANAWLVYEQIANSSMFGDELICPESLDFSERPTNITVMIWIYNTLLWTVWFYYMLKILDYVDTAVFILRKKNNQVTPLHIYHHVSTLLISWTLPRYYAVPQALLGTTLNSGIHVLMYAYYLAASYGPDVQKAIAPIKRWLTIMQMTQFVVLGLYAVQNFIPACNRVPNIIGTIYVINLIINFNMFYNFYKNAYIKPKRKIH